MATVAPGWTVDENGALRRETIHRMGRRRKDWDYCAPCIYEITIVLEDRRSKALGRLAVRNPAACAAGGRTDGGALIADLEACKKSQIFETVTGGKEVA